MKWLVAQLSVWARNRLPVVEIQTAIANVLKQEPLYIYIPVYEDPFGKKDTGFGEYVFINYELDVDYYVIEELDEIVRVLKEPHTKKIQLLSNEEILEIKRKADLEAELSEGDVVRVVTGPLRNNYGMVQFIVENNVNMLVHVGQESLQVTVPVHYVRKSPKRTLLSKREKCSDHFDLTADPPEKSQLNFGELPRIQILRRGVRKTRVFIDKRVYQIPNEIIDKILLSSDVLDEKFVDEVSRVVRGESVEGTHVQVEEGNSF